MIASPAPLLLSRGCRTRAFAVVAGLLLPVGAAAQESGVAGLTRPDPFDPTGLTWVAGTTILLIVGIFLYLARKDTFFPYGAAGLSTLALGALVLLRWKMELTSGRGIVVFGVWTVTLLLLALCAVRATGLGRNSKVAGPVAIFALISVTLSLVALLLLMAPWEA